MLRSETDGGTAVKHELQWNDSGRKPWADPARQRFALSWNYCVQTRKGW